MDYINYKNYRIHKCVYDTISIDAVPSTCIIFNGIILPNMTVVQYLPAYGRAQDINRIHTITTDELDIIHSAAECTFGGGPGSLYIDVSYGPNLKLSWVGGSTYINITYYSHIVDKTYKFKVEGWNKVKSILTKCTKHYTLTWTPLCDETIPPPELFAEFSI